MSIYKKSYAIGDRIFDFLARLFLIGSLIAVLVPLIYIVSASLSSPVAVISGKVGLWPVEPTLIGYQAVFKHSAIMWGFANSFYYMLVGTAISLTLTLAAAYPLSRKEFYGRNVIMGLFIFTMLFSGGLIPLYLVVKNLQMIDTRWAMLLPYAISVWNLILARTYFIFSIPDELYEAASLDGCSDMKFLLSVVIPLSKPIIAVIALYYAIGQWNTYFSALIFLRSQSMQPLQIVLRDILIMNQDNITLFSSFDSIKNKQGLSDVLKYSVIVVSSVPLLILYPFIQKYFVKGVMIGAIKG